MESQTNFALLTGEIVTEIPFYAGANTGWITQLWIPLTGSTEILEFKYRL